MATLFLSTSETWEVILSWMHSRHCYYMHGAQHTLSERFVFQAVTTLNSLLSSILLVLARLLLVLHFLFQVLTTVSSYKEASELLQKETLAAPVYYIVAGSEPNEGAVVTRDRNFLRDLWVLNVSSTVPNSWYILETNYVSTRQILNTFNALCGMQECGAVSLSQPPPPPPPQQGMKSWGLHWDEARLPSVPIGFLLCRTTGSWGAWG